MADIKTKKTPVKKSSHPKYSEMIVAAIGSLKERGGSSRVAIIKYINSKYKVSDNTKLVNGQLKAALKKGVLSGTLTQVKGIGASGSFKITKSLPKPKKAAKSPTKKVTKSKVVKSPKKLAKKTPLKKVKAAKKSPKKATKPKKPVAKKSPKKAAKPKAKKAAKKPAKK